MLTVCYGRFLHCHIALYHCKLLTYFIFGLCQCLVSCYGLYVASFKDFVAHYVIVNIFCYVLRHSEYADWRRNNEKAMGSF